MIPSTYWRSFQLGLICFLVVGLAPAGLLAQVNPPLHPHDPHWKKKPRYRPAYDICFPADASSATCTAPPVDSILIDEINEDMLAVNVSDKVYQTNDAGCYKIFRTYTVINWRLYREKCQLDPMSNPVIIDRLAPDYRAAVRGVCVLVRDNVAYLSRDRVISDDDKKVDLSPLCLDNGGWHYRGFMYTQIIKVYDDEAPRIAVPTLEPFATDPQTCLGTLDLTFQATDNCSAQLSLEPTLVMVAPFQTLNSSQTRMPASFDPSWVGEALGSGRFRIKIANLPEGRHDLVVAVRDGCGNLSVATRIPFTISDQRCPAPTCINGLAVALMANGDSTATNTVWAKDFLVRSSFDCNGQGQRNAQGLREVLRYSINRAGQPADSTSTSLVFDCNDAGKQVAVEIHAWDRRGNHDFCRTYALVQDNSQTCPGTPQINGSIATAFGRPLANVAVNIARNDTLAQVFNTDRNGFFQTDPLLPQASYRVVPQAKATDTDGIGNGDLNLLFQLALGNAAPANSNPYLLLAADIDGNGVVNIEDHALLRRIILKRDSFPGGSCWRFIAADYSFANPQRPWSDRLPQYLQFDSLSQARNARFVAYKLGDLDGSFVPGNQYFGAQNQGRGGSVLELGTNPSSLAGGAPWGAQAVPNPFQGSTQLRFNLAEPQMVRFQIWDLTGRVIWQHQQAFGAGEQQINLGTTELGGAQGLLFFSLQTDQGTVPGKMLRQQN